MLTVHEKHKHIKIGSHRGISFEVVTNSLFKSICFVENENLGFDIFAKNKAHFTEDLKVGDEYIENIAKIKIDNFLNGKGL